MAKVNKKEKIQEKPVEEKKQKENYSEESLIRILTYDLPGGKKVLPALTRIKGISWSTSNAICFRLGIDKTKKISELSKEEITKIEEFLQSLEFPDFMLNRKNDFADGVSKHLIGNKLDMTKDFDIRRLKKIRSYKGIRHTSKLPVRGQRTRSHFRVKGRTAVGVKRKK